MKSFHDYLGLSNSCSDDVDDVIGRADRFGFQNFCSPDPKYDLHPSNSFQDIRQNHWTMKCRSPTYIYFMWSIFVSH